jgi:hypothetical protein
MASKQFRCRKCFKAVNSTSGLSRHKCLVPKNAGIQSRSQPRYYDYNAHGEQECPSSLSAPPPSKYYTYAPCNIY